MRLIASARTAAVTLRLAFRSSMTGKVGIVLVCAQTVITSGVLFLIFGTAFAQKGVVNGITLSAAMWSLAMYSLFWGLGVKNIATDIAQGVKDGSIETHLVRPQHFLQHIVAFRVGRQVNAVLIQGCVNSILVLCFVGAPLLVMTAVWWLEVITLFLFGVVLGVLMYICVGLGAFWMEDVKPVTWIADKATMILGGAFVPVAMLPVSIQRIAEWSPFGATISFARAFSPNFGEIFFALLFSQLLWVSIFGCACVALWHSARNRISVNGG